jgi:hypothetical protein
MSLADIPKCECIYYPEYSCHVGYSGKTPISLTGYHVEEPTPDIAGAIDSEALFLISTGQQ